MRPQFESFDLVESESARILIKKAHDEAEQKMTQLLAPLRLERARCQVVAAEGVIPEVLLDIIQRNHIDLAVLGTHGRRAFKKLLLGSVAEEVFRMAPCPVLTVGPKTAPVPARGELRHILYPLEFFPDTSKAAMFVVSLAERYGATLTVMNVSEDMPVSANTAEEFPQVDRTVARRLHLARRLGDQLLAQRLRHSISRAPCARVAKSRAALNLRYCRLAQAAATAGKSG